MLSRLQGCLLFPQTPVVFSFFAIRWCTLVQPVYAPPAASECQSRPFVLCPRRFQCKLVWTSQPEFALFWSPRCNIPCRLRKHSTFDSFVTLGQIFLPLFFSTCSCGWRLRARRVRSPQFSSPRQDKGCYRINSGRGVLGRFNRHLELALIDVSHPFFSVRS